VNLSTTTPSELYERRSLTAAASRVLCRALPFNWVWGAAGFTINSFGSTLDPKQPTLKTKQNLKQIV
jgi:hypothetical protein